MVKKPPLFDSELAGAVKESAQQIWLAGMGAFAKAQAEGGKVFEALVKEGVSLQRKTQAAAEEKLGDLGGKAGASWDRLENLFEERTAKALGRLGVPTARELAELNRRVDELSAAVANLAEAPSASNAPAKKAPARRAARKTAAPD
jgi:poly(hydroxyalkanoate) granule-associated protein